MPVISEHMDPSPRNLELHSRFKLQIHGAGDGSYRI